MLEFNRKHRVNVWWADLPLGWEAISDFYFNWTLNSEPDEYHLFPALFASDLCTRPYLTYKIVYYLRDLQRGCEPNSCQNLLSAPSLTTNPMLSGLAPVPGRHRSAVQLFELWSTASECTIKGSQDLTMNRPGVSRKNCMSAHDSEQSEWNRRVCAHEWLPAPVVLVWTNFLGGQAAGICALKFFYFIMMIAGVLLLFSN